MSGETAPQLPRTISTLRLRLDLLEPATAAALRSGERERRWHPQFPREEDRFAATLTEVPGGWGARLVVRSFDDLVVGTIGCFAAPAEEVDGRAEVEIGFGLVPDAHGHGAGREAVRGLLGEIDRVGVRVRARVDPTNARSLRLLAGCGFTELRAADADGYLVLARPVPEPSPGADG